MPRPALQYSRNATVFGSPKTAALYFDKIFPLPGSPSLMDETEELFCLPAEKTDDLFHTDMPLDDVRKVLQLLRKLDRKYGGMELDEDDSFPASPNGTSLFQLNRVERIAYETAINCNMCESTELVFDRMPMKITSTKKGAGSDKIYLKLTNLNLVDARTAPWEQILEFRSDPIAKKAFIRLRDFVFTSCHDLSGDALKDRLFVTMDDYDQLRKKHGFDAAKAGMDILLTSKTLLKAAGVGFLGLLTSHTLEMNPTVAASVLGGTAFVFDCARAAIATKSALNEGEICSARNPAHWVFLANERLKLPPSISI